MSLTPFGSGRFIEYVLERPDVQKTWRGHTEHVFVTGLADGTLPVSAFKYYLIQDYLFLVCTLSKVGCERYLTLAGSIRKGECVSGIQGQDNWRYYFSKWINARLMPKLMNWKAAKIVGHIHHEMGLHIDYCKDFGVTKEEIEMTEESQGMDDSLEIIELINYSPSLHCVHQVWNCIRC